MPVDPSKLSRARKAAYFVSNLFAQGLIGAARLVPYELRVPMMGRLARLGGRLAGFDRRIRTNLAVARPDLSDQEVAHLLRAVPDNAGRYMIEMFSGREFVDRVKDTPIEGPGLAALEQARAEGRPVILAVSHFGNYDAARAALVARGFHLGGLYRRMANPYFNDRYVRAMRAIGGDLFEQGRRGMVEMVRHLKGGGTIAILTDIHVNGGEELRFFGLPALTSVVMAELALKYGAPLIPVYGIRQPDGLSFRIELHEPIPHSDPRTMMQQVNDDLEAMVRRHMGQWFWIHKRWKQWNGLGIDPEEMVRARRRAGN